MTERLSYLANKASSVLRKHPEMVGGSAVLTGLYATSLYRYVLFHSLVEMFSIIVACGIFMVFWNSRRFLSNGYFLFIGIAFLCVGCIDLLHTLTYKGMGVFPDDDGNRSIQLWIAARYLLSLSFIAACLFLRRRLNVQIVATVRIDSIGGIASVRHIASHVVPVEPAARRTAFGWLLLGANLNSIVCQCGEAVSFRCFRGCG